MNGSIEKSVVTYGGHGDRPPAAISIGLLGPFHVEVNEFPVSLTAGRLRTLLAALALSSGQVMTVDRLATAVWGDEHRPHNVRRSVQTYIARLRNQLGPASIGWTPTGYVLHAAPENVDALRFIRLLGDASAASHIMAERAWLTEALALWRGEPFEGVPSPSLKESEAPWLLERYLTALERRLDLDLAAGRHQELIPELSKLANRHPLREPLWMRLLIALDRSGRRGDALAQYEVIRLRIAAELGADPDLTLQRIHADLLTRRPPDLDTAWTSTIAKQI